ncbi:hypothetical protein [Sphingobium sp. YBL2]|uniref:hypothetical protein n=1 Tax=Sphingobium sp. (strain YBL2) TaxID=484429 RepID=UPI0005CC8B7E|nr:hypothetical protein [Sphingobium sp. YBL2]AJR24576.1 hypothetical protein TZ53_13440 [Sphingobium sp. YBL2]
MKFDYHREMAEAAAARASAELDRLEWVMTKEHITALRQHLVEDLGVDDRADRMFGIPVVVGMPKDGAPFELRRRA